MTDASAKCTVQPFPGKLLWLLLPSGITAIVIGVYGSDPDDYVRSQTAYFLAINKNLPALPALWWNITALGDAVLLFPLLSLLIFRSPRAWAAMFGAVPLASVLSYCGKKIFAMPRPATVIDTEQFIVIGETLRAHTSLPSGHTIAAFTVAVAVACVLLSEGREKHAVWWSAVLVLLACMVAFSRVAVGAHWPADVLLGAVFGFFSGLSGALLALRYRAWWAWMARKKFRMANALVLLVFGVALVLETKYHDIVLFWVSLAVAGLALLRLLINRYSGALYDQ